MSVRKTIVVATLLAAVTLPACATSHTTRRGPTSHHFVQKKLKKGFKPASGIAPQRATQIQAALIKSGYLSGAPTGSMDAATNAALAKLQADNGWQTKITPDARALIKLGLGPQNNGAESAALVTNSSPTAPQETSN
jgi:hypothetical protein